MAQFPEFPFLTEDFSPRGGGIDFLGMRQVNLAILAEHLIPGINNVTADLGTYCIATWIPWKFLELCRSRHDFSLKKYTPYREAIEVAIAHVMRDGSPSCIEYGKPITRVGVEQKLHLPSKLSFEKANRSESTSIYHAAFYGPSLEFLGLLSRSAQAEHGRSINVPVTLTDEDSQTIVDCVDSALRQSSFYEVFEQVDIPEVSGKQLDDLGLYGLNPSYFRKHGDRLRTAFIRKFLPESAQPETNGRTLSAKLITATLRQSGPTDLDGLRAIWHTGLIREGRQLLLADPDLVNQRELWSIFQARQYERYILELFRVCFELALIDDCRSIAEAVEYWIGSLDKKQTTFEQVLLAESEWLGVHGGFVEISELWNQQVHGQHHAYEWVDRASPREECSRALKMLARWWLRTLCWPDLYENKDLLNHGGRGRISMCWLSRWLDDRKTAPVRDLLRDIFSDLVFAQHIRVALYRFDGEVQRLRFGLGDQGIVPTTSAAASMGKGSVPWMDDRLRSLVCLLCDLSLLRQDNDGQLTLLQDQDS